jgi:hypothetical protein
MQVRLHGRPPVRLPRPVARREGRGLPFSKNREPEVCGLDRFVVPLLIDIYDVYLPWALFRFLTHCSKR